MLSSWKEIATYLGCNIRTSRRWEKLLGLPVHRIEGSPRSRVFAYKNELDAWVKKRNDVLPGRPGKTIKQVFLSLRSAWGLLVLASVAAILFPFFLKRANSLCPFRTEIQGSELVVFDKKAHELWRKNTYLENLQTNDFYQSRFNKKSAPDKNPLNGLPVSFIRDINKDRRPEILFSIQTVDQTNPILICYDHMGKELWRFRGGKEMIFGSTVYYSDYEIAGFDISDFDNDGRDEIFVLSYHRPDWPTQLVLLDCEGKKLGEYWNSGQLNDYLVLDLNEDGKKELILVGLNNEYRKGCLLAFDPGNISGGSPQIKDEFISPDLGPGSELYYLLFPRTNADLAKYGAEYESIASIRQVNATVLLLRTYVSDIYFYLNHRFIAQSIAFSHQFERLHNETKQSAQIVGTLDEQYKKKLIEGILYFNGQSWTQSPTPRRLPGG